MLKSLRFSGYARDCLQAGPFLGVNFGLLHLRDSNSVPVGATYYNLFLDHPSLRADSGTLTLPNHHFPYNEARGRLLGGNRAVLGTPATKHRAIRTLIHLNLPN